MMTIIDRPAPQQDRAPLENRKAYQPSSDHPYNRAAAAVVRAGVRTASAAPPGSALRKNL